MIRDTSGDNLSRPYGTGSSGRSVPGVRTPGYCQPSRWDCGRKNAPPLFETLEVLGKEKVLERVVHAIEGVQ
ncbi:MAG: hypothetical protein LAN64_03880 [Acidobacteriia bacterium]|nr:hypothetical protein [Terriglobia bacterium]